MLGKLPRPHQPEATLHDSSTSVRAPREETLIQENTSLNTAYEIDNSQDSTQQRIPLPLSDFGPGRIPPAKQKRPTDEGESRRTSCNSVERTSAGASASFIPEIPKPTSISDRTNLRPCLNSSRSHPHDSVQGTVREDARHPLLTADGIIVGQNMRSAQDLDTERTSFQVDPLLTAQPQIVAMSNNGAEYTSAANSAPYPSLTDGLTSFTPSHKRAHKEHDDSRKRAQYQPRAIPDPDFWCSLYSAHTRRLKDDADLEYERMMHDCLQAVSQRIRVVSALQERNSIERPRLHLLQDACSRFDHSYLLLHQLYCWTGVNSNAPHPPAFGFTDTHRIGLEVLKFPLAPNDNLTASAVDWFSCFPGPLTMAFPNSTTQDPGSKWYAMVLCTLTDMARGWDELRVLCSSRHLPPLVSEMLVMLSIDSVVLQEVVFRAMLRDVFLGPPDPCFKKHEEIFFRNQVKVMGDYTLVLRSTGHRNDDLAFADEHHKVRVSHLPHVSSIPDERPLPSTGPGPCILPPAARSSNDPRHTRVSGSPQSNDFIPSLTNIHVQAARQNSNPNTSAISSSLNNTSHSVPTGSLRNSSSLARNQKARTGDDLRSQSRSIPQSPILSHSVQNFGTSVDQPERDPSCPERTESLPDTVCALNTYDNASTSNSSPTSMINYTAHALIPSDKTTGRDSRRDSRPGVVSPALMHSWQVLMSETSLAGRPTLNRQQPVPSPTASFTSFQTQQQTVSTSIHRPQSSHFIQPRHDQCLDRFICLPPPMSQYALPTPPNPAITALHQAQALSPCVVTSLDVLTVPEQCFQFTNTVHRPPEAVSWKARYQQYLVDLKSSKIDLLARDVYPLHGWPPKRHAPPGSLSYRIRCLQVKAASAVPCEEDWVTADHVWPSFLALTLNDVVLELCRKSHYGKDLPIDVTRIIKEGPNILTVAILDTPKSSTEQYAIGLEEIKMISHSVLTREIPEIDWHQARHLILSKATPADPDVEVLQPDITIDLTDPFTATIFNVPARGKKCQHNQCFDLETFLSTRSSKGKGNNEPCSPDDFKCPICKGDVRPGYLIIDGFLSKIRETLQAQGRLDVKAVVLGMNGEWHIQEEEEVKGETGDGNGRPRNASGQPVDTAHRGSVSFVPGPNGTESTVIELDND